MSTQRFFSVIRPLFHGGRMTQAQVDGTNLILQHCMDARANRQSTAYILATAFHETGERMQPVQENLDYTAERIKEVFGARAQGREVELSNNPMALANVVYAGRNGNGDEASGDGYRFCGKGHVQLTWRDNYRRMGERLGVDLEGDPGLALDPAISTRILVEGMLSGAFTGVSLDDVSEPETSEPDFTNDRAVVNGRDRAVKIATYARVFYEALADVDLLAKSRTVKAAKATRRASDAGAIISATTAVVTGAGRVLTENTDEIISTAQQGVTLGNILHWAPPAVALVLVVLFVINRMQANRVEDARREDNDVRGV